MEAGSSNNPPGKAEKKKDGGANGSSRPGSTLPRIDPFVPRKDHNPGDLRSWAKKTGFVSDFSGETSTSVSEKFSSGVDLEKGVDHRGGGSSPKIEIDPILGRTRRGTEFESDSGFGPGRGVRKKENEGIVGIIDGTARAENQRRGTVNEPVLGPKEDERNVDGTGHANGIFGLGTKMPMEE